MANEEQPRWSQKPVPEGVKPVEYGNLFNIESHNGQMLDGREIQTRVWTHVCSARFGEGRPCGFSSTTKWTADSYRYDIYKKDATANPTGTMPVPPTRTQYAMRWWNGSGEGWFIDEDGERVGIQSILAVIASNPDENRRWDYCHMLYQTATSHTTAAKCETQRKYEMAFLEKRLKRKRRNNRIYVEVTTPTLTGKVVESEGMKAEFPDPNTAIITLGG